MGRVRSGVQVESRRSTFDLRVIGTDGAATVVVVWSIAPVEIPRLGSAAQASVKPRRTVRPLEVGHLLHHYDTYGGRCG